MNVGGLHISSLFLKGKSECPGEPGIKNVFFSFSFPQVQG